MTEWGAVTLAQAGERALLAAMRAAADSAGRHDDIVIGTGDDAAVITGSGLTVLSVDTAVCGRHFRLDWSTPRQAGARAVVASVADVAAMGARLTGVLVSLAAPPDTLVSTILGLNEGIVERTHRFGGRVLGGDLVCAAEISLSVTSVGLLDGPPPATLSDARMGDLLAVSGPLGRSAAGFAACSAGLEGVRARAATHRQRTAVDAAVDGFLVPQPALERGVQAAAAGVRAMTDISDGLIEELITMSAASGVRVEVSSSALPLADGIDEVAAVLGEPPATPVKWALTGGEDHELLAAFTGPVPSGWTVIGEVTGGDPGVLIDGEPPTGLRGWQTF